MRLLCLFSVLALGALPARADAPSRGRALALVIGENRGLEEDEQLRFAQLDAVRVADTLVAVGGFSREDVTVLQGASAPAVRDALAALQQRFAAGPVERVLLYVSSHAADGALHLAGTRLLLAELVDFLKAAPVQVGVLIVDACQSGRVTRLKGLKPTDLPVTRLEATQVAGRVLISASGADEYAQESDALQGSTFTHYLLTGLRGAADASGDGQITLDEVYAWAWARTIEATFSSRGGVQRPAFSVDLEGQGQLVLATPGRAASRLILDEREPGRWLVVAEANGAIFADVEKREGPLALAVPGGRYRVQLRTAEGAREKVVEVPAAGEARVGRGELQAMSALRVARKGGEEASLVLSAGGGVASGLLLGLSVQPGAELRLRRDGHLAGPLNQLHATFALRGGRALSGSFSQAELELRLGAGHRFAAPAVSLAVGLEVGPLLVFQAELPDTTSRTSLGLATILGVEGRVRLAERLEAFLLGSAGGALIKVVDGLRYTPRLSATLGLALRL